MNAFHQILISATPGDATTNAALELQSLLRRVGPSDVFAWFVHEDLSRQVIPLTIFDEWCSDRSHRPLLIFHATIGSPDTFGFLMERREKIVLVYHNVSPEAPFFQYDPAFAGELEAGRRQLARLRDRIALAVADSPFNARDLAAMGYEDIRVVPPLVDLDRLLEAVPDTLLSKRLAADNAPVILFVGQTLPHKRPDLLLQSFHILSTYLHPEARLFMAGGHRLPAYSDSLAQFARELNLVRASILGKVSRFELAALYRAADVFITMSEHEGFCVPLLEAMVFGVPIVARSMAAIPETLGSAGLLLGEEASPSLAAEAIAMLLENPTLSESIAELGRRRLLDFNSDKSGALFIEQLLSVV